MAAQELQAEAWGRGRPVSWRCCGGENFEPTRAAAHLADSIEGLGGAGRSQVIAAYLAAGAAAELELSPGAARTLEALAGSGIQLGIVCDVGLTGLGAPAYGPRTRRRPAPLSGLGLFG